MNVTIRDRRLRTLLFLLLFAAVLAPLELLLARLEGGREARRDTAHGGYVPVRLESNFRGTVAGLSFTTNRYGFRGSDDYPRTPPPGERRILVVGDSVGFGFGVQPAERFSEVLERGLQARAGEGERWRVINASGQGYSPSSYHAWLAREGVEFQPELVLVQIELCNDVTDEALLWWQGRDRHGGPRVVRGGRYLVAWDGNLLGTVAAGPYPPERTYLSALLLRRLLGTWWDWWPRGELARQPPPPYFHIGFDRPLLTPGRVEGGWRQLFEALDSSRRLLESRGVRLAVLIVPSRYVFEQGGSRGRAARAFLERASEMARQRGLDTLLVEPELGRVGGADRYLDFAHPDARGHELIGRLAVERLHGSVARPSRP